MTVPNDRYWAKVLFKEFIRHYRKLSDEEIIKDVKDSMDDLDDLNDSGSSFGSKMVSWSLDRKTSAAATASRANGKLGGRPSKNGGKNGGRSPVPADKQDVIDFAVEHGLDVDDAVQTWFMTTERGGKTRDGKKILNWNGYLVQSCRTIRENRAREEEDPPFENGDFDVPF